MPSVNKITLVGNLGADPEVRFMPNGSPVANLRVATTDKWKDKQTGQMQEHTEWHRVVLFGQPAEYARDYARKGSTVYIEGSNRTRKWQDNQGNDKWTTEIKGREFQLFSNGGGQQQSDNQGHPEPQSHPTPASQPDYLDDDIPF